MRLATWNINGIRARLDLLEQWLKEREPDVVGLQEIKCQDEEFPAGYFNSLNYDVYTHGQTGGRNGVAILARCDVELLHRGLPGQSENGARLITVKIDHLTFTSVYCPNGKEPEHQDFQMKLEWFDSLCDYWRDLTSTHDAALIGGDFNVVPTFRDSWRGRDGDGRMFHTMDERAQLKKFVRINLHDLYRELNPGHTEFSWWDYRGGAFEKNQGLRIDMLYGTPKIRADTKSVMIDHAYRSGDEERKPSDHVPVVAELI